jgi:protoporphyrinogen oxidase
MTSTSRIETSEPPDRLDGERGLVVISVGPAGLTAAFQLHKHGLRRTVLEPNDQVGGISRTVERGDWRFDSADVASSRRRGR